MIEENAQEHQLTAVKFFVLLMLLMSKSKVHRLGSIEKITKQIYFLLSGSHHLFSCRSHEALPNIIQLTCACALFRPLLGMMMKHSRGHTLCQISSTKRRKTSGALDGARTGIYVP
jgi:hypothetical protein